LSRRGVILAVCSKNEEANAVEPFDKHPDMVLRRNDIACFVANWQPKPDNIRAIAAELNIGVDSLVFVDDNPMERDIVRQELPMVAVPEVGDDPTYFPVAVAQAGYFEGLSITDEDRERSAQYQENRARDALRASATDLDSYLRGLDMKLVWRKFDKIGLPRIVQLINRSNQFNLTTKRYTDEDVLAVMDNPRAFGLQLRLLDRFGDNGVIAIIIGRLQQDRDLDIDTWLMSCRVLGRQVEPTTLNLIVEQAAKLGAERVIGEYIPTKKNGMVKEHYAKLGFQVVDTDEKGGNRNMLDVASYVPTPTFIEVVEGVSDDGDGSGYLRGPDRDFPGRVHARRHGAVARADRQDGRRLGLVQTDRDRHGRRGEMGDQIHHARAGWAAMRGGSGEGGGGQGGVG
jgi:FkbH-like protein